MTFRQIAKEVMRSKGMSPQDIELGMKASDIASPGANVDREIPPEDEAMIRKHLSELHDAAMRSPLEVGIMLQQHMRRN
jgi:hypothetical protein